MGVEAARAGNSGKGFVVVAQEVRRLAERSRTTATEIKAVSEQTVSRSERAAQSLASLTPIIKRTAELVAEIAGASHQQDKGTTEIGQALHELNNTIQRNAASAEELAASAQSLASEAGTLEQGTAYFRLLPE